MVHRLNATESEQIEDSEHNHYTEVAEELWGQDFGRRYAPFADGESYGPLASDGDEGTENDENQHRVLTEIEECEDNVNEQEQQCVVEAPWLREDRCELPS